MQGLIIIRHHPCFRRRVRSAQSLAALVGRAPATTYAICMPQSLCMARSFHLHATITLHATVHSISMPQSFQHARAALPPSGVVGVGWARAWDRPYAGSPIYGSPPPPLPSRTDCSTVEREPCAGGLSRRSPPPPPPTRESRAPPGPRSLPYADAHVCMCMHARSPLSPPPSIYAPWTWTAPHGRPLAGGRRGDSRQPLGPPTSTDFGVFGLGKGGEGTMGREAGR